MNIYADTKEEALIKLDKEMNLSGLDYSLIDSNGRIWKTKWIPKVGDEVSFSINGDTYDEGEVTRATACRFTTSTGRSFSWSRKYQRWCPKGSPAHYHSAHPRVPEKRDPHF